MGMKIGDKMKRFKFNHHDIDYVEDMDKYCNLMGTVERIEEDRFKIQFHDDWFWYPMIKNKIQTKLK